MAIHNNEMLEPAFSDPSRLARAFNRHTYGMIAWMDLFGGRLKSIKLLEMKPAAAQLIADEIYADRENEEIKWYVS
jgi:hypothetical protein